MNPYEPNIVHIPVDGAPASFAVYLEALSVDSQFTDRYRELLCDTGGEAFFWEHPPLTRSTLDEPARVALLPAPALMNTQIDAGAFSEHFTDTPGRSVARFRNLGGDATLIAPRPTTPLRDFSHLGAFLRQATDEQCRALWQEAAAAVQETLGEQPIWLNTSGLGVSWLHLRIDSTPKYYQHHPYKTI